LVPTFIAGAVLSGDDRERLVAGDLVAAVGTPPLVAWAPTADRFLVLENGRAWLGTPRGPIEPLSTLGGEPWGKIELERTRDLGDARDALAHGDAALAAYLTGAGARLVERASEHARTRTQFGRPIGAFQAVSHPLASAVVGLRAAHALALSAGHALA